MVHGIPSQDHDPEKPSHLLLPVLP